MDAQIQQLMRRVPSVDAVLKEPPLEALAAEHGRKPVADAVREAVEEVRRQLLAQPASDLDEAAIRDRIVAAAEGRLEAVMKPVLPPGGQRHRDHPAHRPGPGGPVRPGARPDSADAAKLLAAPGGPRNRQAVPAR